VVARGAARVTVEGDQTFVRSGESTFVQSGRRHRLENPGKVVLEVIEVQLKRIPGGRRHRALTRMTLGGSEPRTYSLFLSKPDNCAAGHFITDTKSGLSTNLCRYDYFLSARGLTFLPVSLIICRERSNKQILNKDATSGRSTFQTIATR